MAFVRKQRLDDIPLIVTEFVAHDSRLRFVSLNPILADIFNGKPPCPEWPNDRAYRRNREADAIDPLRSLAILAMRTF